MQSTEDTTRHVEQKIIEEKNENVSIQKKVNELNGEISETEEPERAKEQRRA